MTSQIPPEFLGAPVFLCIDKEGERIPKATGFFVSVPLESEPDAVLGHLVTARHCIEQARRQGNLYARINLHSGSHVEVPVHPDTWIEHVSADVAARLILPDELPKGASAADLATGGFRLDRFVGPSPEYRYQGPATGIAGDVDIAMTVGEQIYSTGLFSQQHGGENNLPIARFGHIARMPSLLDVEGPDGTSFATTGYLAELQSWGGQSGSPVFFRHTIDLTTTRQLEGKDLEIVVGSGWVTGFMGVISHHYGIMQLASVEGDVLGEVQTALNSGIAAITPAEAVAELLLSEEFAEERRRRVEKLRGLPDTGS